MPNPVPGSRQKPPGGDLVEEIIEDVEDVFQPRPGGMIDRHRQNRAQREAAEAERQNINERVEQPAFKSLKVTQLSPESIATNTVNIPGLSSAMILPLSPYRARALVGLVTPTTPVAAVTVIQPPFTAGGVFTQNQNNFPVAVTFTNGTTFNVFGGGAGNSQIAGGVSGPFTVTIFPGQAIGWNGATVAPTAWTWAPAFGVTMAATLLLAKDSGAALGGQGFTLTYPGLADIRSRAQVWAYNPSSQLVQVSVLSEIYAPESC